MKGKGKGKGINVKVKLSCNKSWRLRWAKEYGVSTLNLDIFHNWGGGEGGRIVRFRRRSHFTPPRKSLCTHFC